MPAVEEAMLPWTAGDMGPRIVGKHVAPQVAQRVSLLSPPLKDQGDGAITQVRSGYVTVEWDSGRVDPCILTGGDTDMLMLSEDRSLHVPSAADAAPPPRPRSWWGGKAGVSRATVALLLLASLLLAAGWVHERREWTITDCCPRCAVSESLVKASEASASESRARLGELEGESRRLRALLEAEKGKVARLSAELAEGLECRAHEGSVGEANESLAKAFSCIQSDGDSAGRIDYDQFWDALAPITENMREQDKQELFMQVDQECSGSVDLFDFLNFFLVTSYEQLQRPITRSGLGSRTASRVARTGGSRGVVGRTVSSHGTSRRQVSNEPTPSFYEQPLICTPATAGHKDVIIGIFRNKATDAYATVARDGTMSTWTKDLKFLRTCTVSDPRQNLGHNQYTSPGIITSACYTPHSCLVGVASMKRQMRFYDVGAPERPGKKDAAVLAFAFRPLPRAVMSLECSWMNDGHEMLVSGDDEGYVSYYKLAPGWNRLDGGVTASYNEKRFMTDFCKTERWDAHNAWVTKARFVDALHSIASSGYDNVFSLFDLESAKIKWSLDASRVQTSGDRAPAHTKGIRTWDWSRQYNIFCSGGVERVISLWSPFVSKPVGSLIGHASSIQQVLTNERQNQIVSLGSDKTVRVWDVRNLKCVCTLQDNMSHIPENRFYNMFMDVTNEQLVLGSGRPHRHRMKRAVSSHESVYGLVAVAVSTVKNLIASADEINEVRMWRAGSGRGVSSFNGCGTESAQITALAFDYEHLRLLVAASDGVIRLCNHGNGLVLKQYHMEGNPLEVHALVSALERGESMIYAATENGGLCSWKDTGDATSDRPIMPERVITGAHDSDVVDAVSLPPDVVITCSYDGRVIVWSGGHLRYVMMDPDHESKPFIVRGMVKLCIITLRRMGSRRQTPAAKSMAATSSTHMGSSYGSAAADTARQPEEAERVKGVLLSAGADGFVHVWDLVIGQHAFKVEVFKPAKSSFGVVSMCVDHSMSFLACGNAHGTVKIFDVTGLQARRDPSSIIPIHTFRTHLNSLISAHFIKTPNSTIQGSSVLVTAAQSEMRMWTAEGEHIGQFGREFWDLTLGVKNRLRRDDIEEEEFVEEDGGRSSVILSDLIDNPASMGNSFDTSEDEIEDHVHGEKDSMSPIAKVVESHLRYFASDDPLQASGPQAKAHKPVMPKDWKKSKKFDVNCFAKMRLKDLDDPKAWRNETTETQAAPLSARPEKHKIRMRNAIREISATPIEMRPGLVFGSSFLKPTTPEIYGLSPLRNRRAHSSMM